MPSSRLRAHTTTRRMSSRKRDRSPAPPSTEGTTTQAVKQVSVDDKCDAFLAGTFESFPRLVPLFKAIERRFPNKKFPPKDTRKEFQMIDLLLDAIGGGAGAEVLEAYLRTPRHRDAVAHLWDSEESRVIENIREMLLDLRTRYAVNHVDSTLNALRINLVKLVQGLPGRGRDKLVEQGL